MSGEFEDFTFVWYENISGILWQFKLPFNLSINSRQGTDKMIIICTSINSNWKIGILTKQLWHEFKYNILVTFLSFPT